MEQVGILSSDLPNGNAQAFNQMTRWVLTKDEHCSKMIDLMANYCLCQRVKKPGAPGSPFADGDEGSYFEALKAHHAVMVAAMVAKQTVDEASVSTLERCVAEWEKMYTPAKEKAPVAAQPAAGHLLGAAAEEQRLSSS